MNEPAAPHYPRRIVVFTVVLLLSLGLCGYTIGGHGGSYVGLEVVVALLGLITGLVGVIASIVRMATSGERPRYPPAPPPPSQTPPPPLP